MDFRHLRYFVAVAQERNFSRAAERLNIAQPPLSRQIRQLEEEIGTDLFDRSSRPLRLTETGRLLYQHALQAISGFDQIGTLMKRQKASPARHFIIGFVNSVLFGNLPKVLRQFRERLHGHAEMSLIEMSSHDQVKALREGRIDAGFGRLRVDDPAVRRIVLTEEPLVAALPDNHPLAAQQTPLQLAQLGAEAMVLYPRPARPSYADQILSLFEDHGLALGFRHEVQELQTALGMVAAGVGVSIVPTSAQSLHRADLLFRPIFEGDAVSPIILNCRANEQSQELELLTQISREIYQDAQADRAISLS